MEKSIQQVAEFHRTFEHPIAVTPQIPPMATVMFRINFMLEELGELKKAAEEGDLVEFADGLGDLRYVLDGFYLNAGLHNVQEAISTEIHRSNMSKACTSKEHAEETIRSLKNQGVDCEYDQNEALFIVKRISDGKVMKALGYSKPVLKPIIDNAAK